MQLNDLIKSHCWASVEQIFLQLYPEQEPFVEEYRKVFEKLNGLEPIGSDMAIVLTEHDCDLDDQSDKSTFVDVSGRKKGPLSESYAIEFTEWVKWLGMDLAPQTTKNFSEMEIVAHCLHEMTFVGFSEEDIKDGLDTIKDRINEYENMTEEEKKKNLITLDELKRRFNERGAI